ncbi:CLUMA_CG013593, isoform A [Clunio marinus]|uniref:CLUMA_CG013593, isoform A n=1 Tax=Clunio marinus TaxID=568069 RepID=A0A1J1IJE6_9DIPT|nr:CLUMA_CG013593, isoform A [Clunio marinus]
MSVVYYEHFSQVLNLSEEKLLNEEATSNSLTAQDHYLVDLTLNESQKEDNIKYKAYTIKPLQHMNLNLGDKRKDNNNCVETSMELRS